MHWRTIAIIAFVTFYGLTGARFGYALTKAFPGGQVGDTVYPHVNLAGATYVALTWPAWLKGSPIPQPPVPRWAFSFELTKG